MRNVVYQKEIRLRQIVGPDDLSVPNLLYAILAEIPRLSSDVTITVWVIGDQVHVSGDWFSPPVVLPLDYVCKELAARLPTYYNRAAVRVMYSFFKDVGYE